MVCPSGKLFAAPLSMYTKTDNSSPALTARPLFHSSSLVEYLSAIPKSMGGKLVHVSPGEAKLIRNGFNVATLGGLGHCLIYPLFPADVIIEFSPTVGLLGGTSRSVDSVPSAAVTLISKYKNRSVSKPGAR